MTLSLIVAASCFNGPAVMTRSPTRFSVSFAPTMNIDTVENVPDALSELFDRLDTSRQGSITLTDFTSTWTAGHENKEYGGQWEARQARAGARRIRRLFGCDGPDGCATDLKKEDFVSHFQGEYDKRMARGLPERRAVAEILCNIPQRALFAEMYGSE